MNGIGVLVSFIVCIDDESVLLHLRIRGSSQSQLGLSRDEVAHFMRHAVASICDLFSTCRHTRRPCS
jgi:hypothetical protein